MAKTALTQLQEQIESIRREAFAEGYAAAMQAVREFAVRPAGAASRPAGAAPRPAAAAPRPGRKARPRQPARAERRAQARRAKAAAPARPQRGNNARLIEEVLQGMAPRAVRPAEIRNALRREKGIAMAFTSIRHALAQLQARRTAEQIGNTRTWRYLPQGGGAGTSG